MTASHLLLATSDLARHLVERFDEESELVIGESRQTLAVVARGHGARPDGQDANRRHEAMGKEEGHPDRRQDAEHEDQRQGQHEAELERFPEVGQASVVREGGLYLLGQTAHLA